MKVLAVALMFLLTLVPQSTFAHDKVVLKAHQTTHVIVESTILHDGKCSATAVGPHALLTASHCEMPTDTIEIDGEDTDILGLLRDGNDHTIYFVKHEFKEWATFSKEKPQMGDPVFIVGNPGKAEDFLRKGYVSKVEIPEGLVTLVYPKAPALIILDLNGYFGDSGAAVFDENGDIVSAISTVGVQVDKDRNPSVLMKMTAGFSLGFTSEQIKKVLEFGNTSESSN
jgi:hypothetical protein